MFKIAIRNLRRNTMKTVITVLLITISAMIIFLAEGLLSSGKSHFEYSARNFFSGDIVITGNTKSKNSSSTLFGVQQKISIGGYNLKTPLIDNIDKTEQLVSSVAEIKNFSKSVLSSAYIRPPYDELPLSWKPKPENVVYTPVSFLAGADKNYFTILPSITVTEGEAVNENDKNTVILSNSVRNNYETYYERELHIGDKILLLRGQKIQRVTVKGFYDIKDTNGIFSTGIYSDIDSVRVISDLILAANIAVALPENFDASAFSDDDDEIFSDENLLVKASALASPRTEKGEDFYDNLLGGTELRAKLNLPDPNAWHFIHIRLNKNDEEAAVIGKLNSLFAENNLNNRAVPYQVAVGSISEKIDNTHFIFKCLVLFFSVIVFVVVCNTLIVSVLERKREIGTMRALGISSLSVQNIFFTESFCLASAGSILGIICGVIIAVILNMSGISLKGLSLYVGRSTVYISIKASSIIFIFLYMNAASFIATVYPARIVSGITPVTAMQNER